MNDGSYPHSLSEASASQEEDHQYLTSYSSGFPAQGIPAHYAAYPQPSPEHPENPLKWRTYTLGAHINYPYTDVGGSQSPNPSTASYPNPSPHSNASMGWASAPSTTRCPTPVDAKPTSSRASTSRSRAKSEDVPEMKCTHCSVTSTPLWRKNPDTRDILCNACGLYILEHGHLRPPELIAADIDDDDDGAPQQPGPEGGKECSHCGSRNTSAWRRDRETGEHLCNACGVYLKLRGEKRPLRLKKNKFKPRPSSATKASSQPIPEVRVFHW